MSYQLIKELQGFSGSRVTLLQGPKGLFVRKQGNVDRNLERYTCLRNIVAVPAIYNSSSDSFDMEFIQGLDVKQFLKYNDSKLLANFIIDTIGTFRQTSVTKDYTETYKQKLNWLDTQDFLFTKDEIIAKLPKYLPQSIYHGDFTLDNFIFGNNKQFYLIDPLTSEYDSYIFDLAKLRQDLESKWFVRNDLYYLDAELSKLQETIFKELDIEVDNYLLILMLLRVYPYCKNGSTEQAYIKREIKRLWK